MGLRIKLRVQENIQVFDRHQELKEKRYLVLGDEFALRSFVQQIYESQIQPFNRKMPPNELNEKWK